MLNSTANKITRASGAHPKMRSGLIPTQADASIPVANCVAHHGPVAVPGISYIRNNSNIVIFDFDRTDVSNTIRRDFK
jgi:hypothetical protein